MNTYQIDTDVQLTTTFTRLSDGTAIDPTTVSLVETNPAGVEVTYVYGSSAITRTGTGAYAMTITPNMAGYWTYKWKGAGSVNITSPDTVINIASSRLITS